MPFPSGRPIQEDFGDVEWLPDGKLLVSATIDTGAAAATDRAVLRLHADGSLDAAFRVSGGLTT